MVCKSIHPQVSTFQLSKLTFLQNLLYYTRIQLDMENMLINHHLKFHQSDNLQLKAHRFLDILVKQSAEYISFQLGI